MDGVHVARLGLDSVVIGSHLSDGTHEAAAHHAHTSAHAAAATALAVATAISLAGVLVRNLAGWRSGTGILSDGCCSEGKDGEHCGQKTEFHQSSQGGAKASLTDRRVREGVGRRGAWSSLLNLDFTEKQPRVSIPLGSHERQKQEQPRVLRLHLPQKARQTPLRMTNLLWCELDSL
jgi:hypothetical protein